MSLPRLPKLPDPPCLDGKKTNNGYFDPTDGRKVLSVLRDELQAPVRSEILLVFEPGTFNNHVDARQTVLLGVRETGEAVLAQTDPPVPPSLVGAPVTLATVVRGDESPLRCGVSAHLTSLAEQIRGPEHDETVIVARLDSPLQMFKINARASVRVDLDGQSLITFSSKDLALVPLNISLGGVGFSCAKGALEMGQTLLLELSVQGRIISLEVKVVRLRELSFRQAYVGAKIVRAWEDNVPFTKVKTAIQSAILAEQARQIGRLRGWAWN